MFLKTLTYTPAFFLPLEDATERSILNKSGCGLYSTSPIPSTSTTTVVCAMQHTEQSVKHVSEKWDMWLWCNLTLNSGASGYENGWMEGWCKLVQLCKDKDTKIEINRQRERHLMMLKPRWNNTTRMSASTFFTTSSLPNMKIASSTFNNTCYLLKLL